MTEQEQRAHIQIQLDIIGDVEDLISALKEILNSKEPVIAEIRFNQINKGDEHV